MAEPKTKLNDGSVEDFLNAVKDEQVRADCRAIAEIMQKATKAPPKMWGTSIVGFGSVHLKYASGRELDWMKIGFSPRKQNLTLYLMGGLEKYADLFARLGKFKTGVGCVYIKTLAEVDANVLEELIQRAVAETQ